jgi:hypothetical protein
LRAYDVEKEESAARIKMYEADRIEIFKVVKLKAPVAY